MRLTSAGGGSSLTKRTASCCEIKCAVAGLVATTKRRPYLVAVPTTGDAERIAQLGEVGVGFSLLLGFLTPLGAAFGLLQVMFYGMAVQQQSSGQQGFHVMLFVMMLTFLFARAGRQWGIDGWLREKYPASRFVQLLT